MDYKNYDIIVYPDHISSAFSFYRVSVANSAGEVVFSDHKSASSSKYIFFNKTNEQYATDCADAQKELLRIGKFYVDSIKEVL